MLIGIHTGYDPDVNENVGTLITPEIHSWINKTVQDIILNEHNNNKTVQDLAKYTPEEAYSQ